MTSEEFAGCLRLEGDLLDGVDLGEAAEQQMVGDELGVAADDVQADGAELRVDVQFKGDFHVGLREE